MFIIRAAQAAQHGRASASLEAAWFLLLLGDKILGDPMIQLFRGLIHDIQSKQPNLLKLKVSVNPISTAVVSRAYGCPYLYSRGSSLGDWSEGFRYKSKPEIQSKTGLHIA